MLPRQPCVVFLLSLIFAACEKKSVSKQINAGNPAALTNPAALAASADCQQCHQQEFAAWQQSHHHRAHRNTGNAVDAEAFAGSTVSSGDATWTFSGGAESPEISWQDGSQNFQGQPPMAIGLTPLVQYLLATGDGRYQVPDMAWDPAQKEWISIFGQETRRPHEWGHWTGRGMNWNAQCAFCHFTGLRKHYDPATDAYQTSWREQGIGCAQCHGPDRSQHATTACRIPAAQKFTTEQWTQSCATCHSRREEFDESFTTGRSFHDHYALTLPDVPGLWFPDGQQLDEDYNLTGLLLSRMGHKGIGCTDCHDPHHATAKGGKPAVPTNALCLTCHATGERGATRIDAATHSHHPPGTAGSRCIDCHMPTRTYMARDPRHDHRFPIPDPTLTKELGVPNACATCHSDRDLDWQIAKTKEWWGPEINTATRRRARAVAAAQAGQPGAQESLLDALDHEEIDAWQATLLRLLEPAAAAPPVVRRANVAIHEGGPLARAAAARLIAVRGDTGPLLEKALSDPLKAVRLAAAWAALDRLPPAHPVLAELAAVARHQSDQPAGAMRMAQLAHARHDPAETEKWLRKAADWDRGSPLARHDLAVFLANLGRSKESLRWLEEAARLAPENAEYPYLMALAHAETGDLDAAEAQFQQALSLDPHYARAWYNLGLLQAGKNQLAAAIHSLRQAELEDPHSADAPYARATIHLRQGDSTSARAAAQEALRRNPADARARQLLSELE